MSHIVLDDDAGRPQLGDVDHFTGILWVEGFPMHHGYDKEVVTIYPDGTRHAYGVNKRTPARSTAHQLARDIIDWVRVILSLAVMIGVVAGLISITCWAFGLDFWKLAVVTFGIGGILALTHDR